MQDQLAGLAGATAQFHAGTGREGFRVEAQAEGQRLAVAAQYAAGEQLLRARTLVDHQERHLDFGTGGHVGQAAADFALIGGQGAEVFNARDFLLLRGCRLRRGRLGGFAAAGDQKTEQAE